VRNGVERRWISAFILAHACSLASFATEQNSPATPGQAGPGEVEMNEMIRSESQQPMNMNEPMPTAMARKGMKIGDVKAHAMKKEAVMDEKMKQEEMKH
jgi:hypothetical protein